MSDTTSTNDKIVTIHTFMADRGAPLMTPVERTAAEHEWKRWEAHIANGGCPSYATVEIRPDNGNFEDLTHSCDDHAGGMLGHRPGAPPPHHYEVRALVGDEARSHWCCQPVKVLVTAPPEVVAPGVDLDSFDHLRAVACAHMGVSEEEGAADLATWDPSDFSTDIAPTVAEYGCAVLAAHPAMVAELRAFRAAEAEEAVELRTSRERINLLTDQLAEAQIVAPRRLADADARGFARALATVVAAKSLDEAIDRLLEVTP